MKYNTVKLGEYLYIKGRIGWKGLKKSEYLEHSEYRIINGEALTEDGINWDKAGFITKERYDESPEIMLKEEDILISKDGTIGKIGFINKLEQPTTVASGIFVIRNLQPEIINTRFIYNFLCSHYFKAFITMRTEGSVIPHLYQKDFVDLDFPLPQKETQEKIVSILDGISAQIDINKKINEKLEEQAKAIFKSWFIDFEPFEGKVPLNWENGVLGDFVKIKRGGSPRPISQFLSTSGLHWLKISDATCTNSPFINKIKEYIIEDGLKKTVFLKSGNLVLSNSATPGLPKILDIDTCIHDGWLYFPQSRFSNEYLYLYFTLIRNNLVSLGNGSVFTNLKTDILKNYPTYLPTNDILNKFDNIIKPIFSIILTKQEK
ncbi:restriction endonuclease subunit S [Anaerofustis sp. HA2171]|uniref:restriction endonuclease subunit S n=1 Tax=Anaerofustis butyriciformans TaxID=3108533 RepID=UPI002E2FDF1D|nr:restriction endonuclease subunit S [Anaerofustis sp. HA2171]